MSIGIDPRKLIELSLPYEYNGEPKPVFKFRRLTTAEYMEIIESGDAPAHSNAEWADNAFKLVSIGLMDWSNQNNPATGESIPFDLARIRDVLNPDEALALVAQRARYARVTGDAKKNSASGAG